MKYLTFNFEESAYTKEEIVGRFTVKQKASIDKQVELRRYKVTCSHCNHEMEETHSSVGIILYNFMDPITKDYHLYKCEGCNKELYVSKNHKMHYKFFDEYGKQLTDEQFEPWDKTVKQALETIGRINELNKQPEKSVSVDINEID